MTETTQRKMRRWDLALWGCPFSAAVGAFFGLPWWTVGAACGAVGGIVAGVLWSRWMSRWMRNDRPGLMWMAVGLGVAVGLLATGILHAGLLASQALWHWYPDKMDFSLAPGDPFYWGIFVMVALPCGFLAGILGLICGIFCLLAQRRSKQAPPA